MPAYTDAGGNPAYNTAYLDNSAANATDTITFATAQAYTSLSLLLASGHGPVPFDVTVNYADNTSVDLGDYVSPDWFGSGTIAYATSGRYNPSSNSGNGAYQDTSGQPDLFQVDVGLTNTTLAVTGVTIKYDGATTGNGTVSLFAVSGGTLVPEPASAGLIGLAAGVGLLRRGRGRARA